MKVASRRHRLHQQAARRNAKYKKNRDEGGAEKPQPTGRSLLQQINNNYLIDIQNSEQEGQPIKLQQQISEFGYNKKIDNINQTYENDINFIIKAQQQESNRQRSGRRVNKYELHATATGCFTRVQRPQKKRSPESRNKQTT
ncbi:Hypothetical_protein [Hexamita inflata]|uniref:Hypothetical_protein n=1 Tax=Hexamita inflata TaxID=28002 RepID=A0AA86QBG3_9EUKA|nr:Hypothetical protein HINF_LOCUS43611 [Hexamita inflata]